jgi:hypothetical protein
LGRCQGKTIEKVFGGRERKTKFCQATGKIYNM